jgi:glycosyltransferase involved in cell wall biosynthesis
LYNDIIFGGFVFFLLIQLYYSLFFFAKLANFKDNYNSGEHKPLSIIVCAHNELENLERLISAIFAQNYHNFELVIVNDRSFDETELFLKDKVKKYGGKLKVVTIEDTPIKMDPKKYALTLGIKAASHEHMIFTDADCLPFNDKWLLQMQAKFGDKHEIVLGLSQYETTKGFLNLFIRFETFYTSVQYLSFALKGLAYMGVGRNLGYTKRIFFNSKGFHPNMDVTGGDDDLFINKIAKETGVRIAVMVESQTLSVPKGTWKEWFIQKTRHLSVGKYYDRKTKFLLGLLNTSHFFTFVLFIIVIVNGEYLIYGLVGFLLRILVNLIIFSLIIKKQRYKLDVLAVPLFDILYPIYYIFVATNALRTKRIRWK